MWDQWPSVGVVIATGDCPDSQQRALRSVLAQKYPGTVRTVVVYDGARPGASLGCAGRPV
jgi:hypothetical protein